MSKLGFVLGFIEQPGTLVQARQRQVVTAWLVPLLAGSPGSRRGGAARAKPPPGAPAMQRGESGGVALL